MITRRRFNNRTTAEQYGVPGEWARVRGTMLSLWPLFLAFTALGAFSSAVIIGRHLVPFAVLFCLSIISVAVLWRKGMRRIERFFRGAHGEEVVARVLTGLPAGYYVFHDFVVGGVHIDHVIAGPTGVFSIETKNWRGPVTVAEGYVLSAGKLPSRNPVKQSVHEADAVKEAIAKAGADGEVGVIPILCFASGSFRGEPERVGGAILMNIGDLAQFVCSQKVVFSMDELERLVQLMMTCSRCI